MINEYMDMLQPVRIPVRPLGYAEIPTKPPGLP